MGTEAAHYSQDIDTTPDPTWCWNPENNQQLLKQDPYLIIRYSSNRTHTYHQILLKQDLYLSSDTPQTEPIPIIRYSSNRTHTYHQILLKQDPYLSSDTPQTEPIPLIRHSSNSTEM